MCRLLGSVSCYVVSYIQKLEEENPEAAAALREKIEADRT